MTFTFDSDTIATSQLTFNVPNGPELALLRLSSQAANQNLNGATSNLGQAWTKNTTGLVMEKTIGNSRFTRYKFKYAEQLGIDDFDIIFTKDVAGVYNFELFDFTQLFIWNLNQNQWNLEPSLWNKDENLNQSLERGLIKIKNVLPVSAPKRTTYISQNEENSNYIFLTNNSI
jgi:hypothetical protein